ncbi:alpha/beta fold hydrolase [Pseudomonas gingeri]|uniref:alpha/beta fold hydrolase n=1 Tax=Pseudomonas gingeri TaxID=117681 RepID=UPI0015A2F663|nr:alpha/beta hydrolase [Pseudomonas gingeri]NWA24393.1 alpha/beta fold hydrolase [Pseudomonas gingeri]NWD67006.1 alpha/beta fold hydrolase [Pseudomonas gingeri]
MKLKPLSYFIAKGETGKLVAQARNRLQGDFVQLSRGVTHYQLAGPANGEVVLLVPGLTIPLFYWDRFVTRLHEQGFRTLAYSAYGRGYSDRVQDAYGVGLFVQQSQELVSALGLAAVDHVIATSMGALIAMALLAEHGLKPKTLTLVGPAGLTRKKALAARVANIPVIAERFGKHLARQSILSHIHHNVNTEADAQYLKAMVSDALGYEGTMYSLLSTLRNFTLIGQQALFRDMGELAIPTLLVWGADDNITPVVHMQEAKVLLKPMNAAVVRECGHMAPLERPDELSQLFIQFLAQVRLSSHVL